jgi:hypothetical protein
MHLIAVLIFGSYVSNPRLINAAENSCTPTIETNISGNYNGWDDEVIYKMDNGQIWQQANYHYHYHYAYHPSVIIYPTRQGCHIKVEDDDDEGVDVVRLK